MRWRETGREERARSERGKKGVNERRSGKERERGRKEKERDIVQTGT